MNIVQIESMKNMSDDSHNDVSICFFANNEMRLSNKESKLLHNVQVDDEYG